MHLIIKGPQPNRIVASVNQQLRLLGHMWLATRSWLHNFRGVNTFAVTCAQRGAAADGGVDHHHHHHHHYVNLHYDLVCAGREHATRTHKFKSNKTFKTNKCHAVDEAFAFKQREE